MPETKNKWWLEKTLLGQWIIRSDTLLVRSFEADKRELAQKQVDELNKTEDTLNEWGNHE